MKTNNLLIFVACAGLFGSCATSATVPNALINARAAFQRARSGDAPEMAPKEMHVAYESLAKAEQAFRANPDSYQARDLAYIAERKSMMAEVIAVINIEQRKQVEADDEYRKVDGEVDTKAKGS